MAVVHVVTTERTFLARSHADETLLETLRRHNLPPLGLLTLDSEQRHVSLAARLGDEDEVWAYSLRNPDFRAISPEYELTLARDPVTEIFRPLGPDQRLSLVQFSRDEGFEYIYSSFRAIVDAYRADTDPTIQVALSAGGDGRVVAECLARYRDERPGASFPCLIVTTGFEDEDQHVAAACETAERFRLDYVVCAGEDAQARLNLRTDFVSLIDEYRQRFPHDELEVLGTYWVQELNLSVAREHGRRAIIFGFNQEDVLAERLFQLMTGRLLDPFPVRTVDEVDLIAPLCRIPKRLIDPMDLENSLRNYGIRVPSVSYLRSSLYLLSYLIVERFPAIADVLCGEGMSACDPDEVLAWLQTA